VQWNESGVTRNKNGKGTQEYGRNKWRMTGHCRRCDNGKYHINRRRGAGGEKPSGVSQAASDPNRIRYIWEDEIAPGEKPMLRRKIRARGKVALRKTIREET